MQQRRVRRLLHAQAATAEHPLLLRPGEPVWLSRQALHRPFDFRCPVFQLFHISLNLFAQSMLPLEIKRSTDIIVTLSSPLLFCRRPLITSNSFLLNQRLTRSEFPQRGLQFCPSSAGAQRRLV